MKKSKLLIVPVLVVVLSLVLAASAWAGCDDPCNPCPPPPPPPCDGDEGCTPGYWKQEHHFDSWPAAYSPGDDFDTIFGTSTDMTLLEALKAKGHGSELYRHGVAALLNAASGDVDYPLTVEEVIAYVQAGEAWPLVDANEEHCPLN